MKEIEYKFLLSEKDKTSLLQFLKTSKAKRLKKEIQDNFYYNAPGDLDLRVRQSEAKSTLILKKGWMHDDDRTEIEVDCARTDFQKLDKILRLLGYEYDTKWHREREEYMLGDFHVTLDFNVGYGWVSEIELVVEKGCEAEAKEKILALAKEIGLKPASKETFNKLYEYYKKNWQQYYENREVFDLEKVLG